MQEWMVGTPSNGKEMQKHFVGDAASSGTMHDYMVGTLKKGKKGKDPFKDAVKSNPFK